MIAEPTGTDGFRLLSHQLSPSSLPHLENCIKSSKTFSLRMKKPREALLQLYNIRGQDQEIRHMVYPLQNGRLSYNVCLRRKNLSEQLRMTMASLMKRYGVLFVLRIAAKRSILEQIC
jgi:cystathionine beta-lyase/cystathionine gamma-synthase